MTAPLTHRSLIGMSHCPYCGRVVYLGDCEPQQDRAPLYHHWKPSDLRYARWWECTHQGPAGTSHQWAAVGMIELRPVTALHVEVEVTARR